MTKQQMIDRIRRDERLLKLGFSRDEIAALHRISATLHRWSELECGTDRGAVERDEVTEKPYFRPPSGGKSWPVADRERGALRRLAAIMAAHPGVRHEVQGDPRGCALSVAGIPIY